MKKTLIGIAFATASMFAAQNPPANPPAAGTTETKPAPVKKVKKHKKASKKSTEKTATPAAAKPVVK